jgi:putative inorganic carbon (hco3(-)) transporter
MKSIEKVILVVFCLFIILVPYFRNISKVFIIAGICLWMILGVLKYKRHFYRIFFVSNFLTKPVLIFLGAAVLSVIFSLDPYNSQKIFFSRYIIYFLFFLTGSGLAINFNLKPPAPVSGIERNMYFLTGALVVSGIVLGIGSIRDYFIFRPDRLFTVFGQQLIFHMLPLFFLFSLPIFLSLTFFGRKWLRILGVSSLFLLSSCCAWTGSRGAWVAVALSAIGMTVLFKRGKKIAISLFVLIMSFAASFYFLVSPDMQLKAANTTSFSTLDIAARHRLELFEAAVEIFKHYPVFGTGLGMYGKVLDEYVPIEWNYLHAHNTYLEVLSEMGVVGFLALVWIFAMFFKKSFRIIKNEKGNTRAILIGLWGIIAAVLVFEFFCSSILVGMQAAPLFWFLLGFTAQSYHKVKSSQV